MSDVRALLAAERQSRRISHPHLSYTKSGILLCTVCQLNVKSEALWEGHLRSANHRRNAQNAQDSGSKSLKRKIEKVDSPVEEPVQKRDDGRKRTKSTLEPVAEESDSALLSSDPVKEVETVEPPAPAPAPEESLASKMPPATNEPPAPTTVDEDEWAAFEREVAPLAKPDYSAATISAAPMTAAQIAAQAEEDKRQRQEFEAEDEKEEEERRMEEEFDIMEEMEERVRKLREKREALRKSMVAEQRADLGLGEDGLPDGEEDPSNQLQESEEKKTEEEEDDDDDEEEEVDDWYS